MRKDPGAARRALLALEVPATMDFGDPGLEWRRLFSEVLGTFMLVWAVIGVAMNPRANRAWAPLVIGTTLGFAVMVLGPLTGAALNPARWFGPALVAGEWSDFWVWIIGPVVGGPLVAVSFWFLLVVERTWWPILGVAPAPDIDPD